MQTSTKTTLHLLALTIILVALAWLHVSSLTFFSSDSGLRLLQVRQLIDKGWQTLAVDYPGRFADPDLDHTPYYYLYSLIDGEIYLNITPFFPIMASFLYVLAGALGLAISPVVGGVLAAWAIYKLARLSQLSRPYWLIWATVFATPLLFYSLELWDHSLATACAAWGVYGAARGMIENQRRYLVLAGVAIGLGLGQRPELYVFALATGLGLLVAAWQRWWHVWALVIGGLLGALPVWISQYTWVGHPLGLAVAPNLFGYGRPGAYPVQAYSEVTLTPALIKGRLLFYVQSRDPVTFTALLLVLVSFLIIFMVLRVERFQQNRLLLAGFVTAIVGYSLWGLVAWQEPITGLLSTFPLLPLGLTYVKKRKAKPPGYHVYHFVFSVVGFFLLLTLALWPSFGGDQWGSRYLLPAYPLLLFLAFYTYEAYIAQLKRPLQPILQLLTAALLILSIGLQLVGLRHLYVNQPENVTMRNAIQALPAQIILTNHPFLPSLMSSVEGKIFMYVDNNHDLVTLIPKFAERGYDRVAILPLEASQLSLSEQIEDVTVRQIGPAVYALENNFPPPAQR